MANIRKGENGKNKAELEMTPMIDVVFLLLIFFMCATKFKVPDYRIDANLPRDQGMRNVKEVEKPKDIPEFKITVEASDAGAQYRIGRDTVVGPGELKDVVEEEYWAIKGDPQYKEEKIPAMIAGEENVEFQYVVLAINASIAANVDEINFAPPTNM